MEHESTYNGQWLRMAVRELDFEERRRKKINAFEMKCCRLSWTAKRTNEWVSRQLGWQEVDLYLSKKESRHTIGTWLSLTELVTNVEDKHQQDR